MVVIPRATIKPGQHAALFAGFDEGLDDVCLIAACADMVIREPGGPKAMPGHVFRRKHGVFHHRIPRDRDPLVHVHFVRGLKRGRLRSVGKFRAGVGADSVMNEHPKFERFLLLEGFE